MSREPFFNRTCEAKRFVEMIEDHSLSNKIIVIAGRTGIGKSAFVNKVLSDDLSAHKSIRVNICKTSESAIDNLHYINAFYRAIVNLANQKLFDKVYSPFQQGIHSLKNLLSFGFDVLLEKTAGSGNKLYEPTDDRSTLHKKDYIISVLRRDKYIVTIDNIQSIDVHSLEILNHILGQISNTTFIFEYTTDEDTISSKLLSFYNALKKYNASVYLFEMKCLDYVEAKKLAPTGVAENIIQDIYQRSNGNLVKIQLADSSADCNDDPIAVKITHLSKDKRFLVNLLYLNESPIFYSDLCRMLIGNIYAPPFSEQKLYKCIYELEKERIIKLFNSGEIGIYHDSIISYLDIQAASVSLYSAYGVLKEYYCSKLSECEGEATEHLFSLYVRFSDTELLALFPQITRLIRSYKYPHAVIYKLISFRRKIQQKRNLSPQLFEKGVTLLVNLCLEFGLWKEALNNLDLIYSPKKPYHRALRAAALALNFADDESISAIHALIQQASSSREKLTLELCLLSAEMARQPRKESIKIAQKMINTSEYRDHFEFAFLLSNYAELICNSEECINLYKQAIERLHRFERDDLSANILVFLSMIYAYEGRIEDARIVLNKGKSLGGIKESYLRNNYAVLDILSKKATADTARQLSDALLLTCDPYERILILCNLLVCYTLLSEMERAKQTVLEIKSQQFEQFQYEEFLHIVYQDLLYYYKSVNLHSEIKVCQQHLQKLIDDSSSNAMFVPIARMQLRNQSASEFFFSQFPFRVDFLGSWNVEISPDLANC